MGKSPSRNSISKKSTAAQKKAVEYRPNFDLVGTPYPVEPAALLDIVRYGDVVKTGKFQWRVRARSIEWVNQLDHTVDLFHGVLYCDCRQGRAQRICPHVIAVRQFGVIVRKALASNYIAMYDEFPVDPVRVIDPDRKRFAPIRIPPQKAREVHPPRVFASQLGNGGAVHV
jgi:hypothetical protein